MIEQLFGCLIVFGYNLIGGYGDLGWFGNFEMVVWGGFAKLFWVVCQWFLLVMGVSLWDLWWS